MAKAGKTLIKELVVNVKGKNIRGTTKDIDSLTNALENSAVGAELLADELGYVPVALKEIQAEAKSTESSFKKLYNSTSGSGLDSLEDKLDDVIIALFDVETAIKTGFSTAMKSATNDANALGAALDRVDDGIADIEIASKKAGAAVSKSGEGYESLNRRLASTNNRGNNTTRMFADMAKSAGPLAASYALVAANVYALSEAFRMISEGDQLNRLEEVGSIMGAKVGLPIQQVALDLQEATNGAINYGQALRQASAASTFGFSSEQISEMGLVARRASVALGVDMTDAMNRVVRGVSKLEIELLDELGITIRLTEAYEAYAKTIGKTANQLTGYEKSQAYLLAVQKQSLENQGVIDEALDPTGWEKLGVAMGDLTNRTKQWIADAGEPLAQKMAEIIELGDFRKTVDSLENYIATSKKAADNFEKGKKAGTEDMFLQGVAGAYLEILKYEEKQGSNLRQLREEREKGIAQLEEQIKQAVELAKTQGPDSLRALADYQKERVAQLEELKELNEKDNALLEQKLRLEELLGVKGEEASTQAKLQYNAAANYALVVKDTYPELQGQLTMLSSQQTEYQKLAQNAKEVLKAVEDSEKQGTRFNEALRKTANEALKIANTMRSFDTSKLIFELEKPKLMYEGLLEGASAYETQLKLNQKELKLLQEEKAKIDITSGDAGDLAAEQDVLKRINANYYERLDLGRSISREKADQAAAEREYANEISNSNSVFLQGLAAHGSAISKLQNERASLLAQRDAYSSGGMTPQEELGFKNRLLQVETAIKAEQAAIRDINRETLVSARQLVYAQEEFALAAAGVSNELVKSEFLLKQQIRENEALLREAREYGKTQSEINNLLADRARLSIQELDIERQKTEEARKRWEFENAPRNLGVQAGPNRLGQVDTAAWELQKSQNALKQQGVELVRLQSSLSKEADESRRQALQQEIDLRQQLLEQQALEVSNRGQELQAAQYSTSREGLANQELGQRTGFEDQTLMNEEERLASRFESGMRLYDSAFSKLSSINPAMGEMFTNFQSLTGAIVNMGEGFEGTMNAIGAGLQFISSAMAYASQQAIGEIGKQIAMEKKRDGKSEESKAKIAKLEAQREAKQKKAAKMQIIMNTAQAVMMALATLPPPVSYAFAATSAAMGAMMLAQADSGSSISGVDEGAGIGKLELGKRDNTVDLAQKASGGELSFMRGERGIGNSGNFAPRARGGRTSPNSGVVLGEHGAEFVSSPAVSGSTVKPINSSSDKPQQPVSITLQVNALDAASIVDRSEDLFAAIEVAANARGFNLGG